MNRRRVHYATKSIITSSLCTNIKTLKCVINITYTTSTRGYCKYTKECVEVAYREHHSRAHTLKHLKSAKCVINITCTTSTRDCKYTKECVDDLEGAAREISHIPECVCDNIHSTRGIVHLYYGSQLRHIFVRAVYNYHKPETRLV